MERRKYMSKKTDYCGKAQSGYEKLLLELAEWINPMDTLKMRIIL